MACTTFDKNQPNRTKCHVNLKIAPFRRFLCGTYYFIVLQPDKRFCFFRINNIYVRRICVALIETTTKTLKQIVYNTYVYAYAVFSRRIQIADFSFPNQFYSVRNARSRFRLSVRKRRANDICLYGLDAFRAKRFIVIENYVREWTNEMYYGVDVVRIPHVRDFACRGSEKLLTLCVVPNAYHLCVCVRTRSGCLLRAVKYSDGSEWK